MSGQDELPSSLWLVMATYVAVGESGLAGLLCFPSYLLRHTETEQMARQ